MADRRNFKQSNYRPKPLPFKDLRELLILKEQQKEHERDGTARQSSSGPPRDPPSLLRDSLRGDEPSTSQQRIDSTQKYTPYGRGSFRRRGDGTRYMQRGSDNMQRGQSLAPNIKVELSAETGHRKCTLDSVIKIEIMTNTGDRKCTYNNVKLPPNTTPGRRDISNDRGNFRGPRRGQGGYRAQYFYRGQNRRYLSRNHDDRKNDPSIKPRIQKEENWDNNVQSNYVKINKNKKYNTETKQNITETAEAYEEENWDNDNIQYTNDNKEHNVKNEECTHGNETEIADQAFEEETYIDKQHKEGVRHDLDKFDNKNAAMNPRQENIDQLVSKCADSEEPKDRIKGTNNKSDKNRTSEKSNKENTKHEIKYQANKYNQGLEHDSRNEKQEVKKNAEKGTATKRTDKELKSTKQDDNISNDNKKINGDKEKQEMVQQHADAETEKVKQNAGKYVPTESDDKALKSIKQDINVSNDNEKITGDIEKQEEVEQSADAKTKEVKENAEKYITTESNEKELIGIEQDNNISNGNKIITGDKEKDVETEEVKQNTEKYIGTENNDKELENIKHGSDVSNDNETIHEDKEKQEEVNQSADAESKGIKQNSEQYIAIADSDKELTCIKQDTNTSNDNKIIKGDKEKQEGVKQGTDAEIY